MPVREIYPCPRRQAGRAPDRFCVIFDFVSRCFVAFRVAFLRSGSALFWRQLATFGATLPKKSLTLLPPIVIFHPPS